MRRLTISLVVASLFILSLVAGFLLVYLEPSWAGSLSKALSEELRRRFPQGFVPGPGMMVTIFLNNFVVALTAIVLGVLTVVAPLFIVIVNGFVVGLVVATAIQSGASPLVVALYILPHGVVELPTILYSAVLGTDLGIAFWIWIINTIRRSGGAGFEHIAKVLRSLFIIAVLLLIAAFIETYITPQIASMAGAGR